MRDLLGNYLKNILHFIATGFQTDSVMEFYNSSAKFYEKAMPKQDELVSRIVGCMPECDTALDIAMGTGITSKHMRNKCKNLISIDFSGSMISEARKKGLESMILKGNFLSLPLKDDSIDVSVCTGAVRHIPEESYDKFFSEVSRVSKIFITEAHDFTLFERIYFRAYGYFMKYLGHSEQPLNSDKTKLCGALSSNKFDVALIPIGPNERNYVIYAAKNP